MNHIIPNEVWDLIFSTFNKSIPLINKYCMYKYNIFIDLSVFDNSKIKKIKNINEMDIIKVDNKKIIHIENTNYDSLMYKNLVNFINLQTLILPTFEYTIKEILPSLTKIKSLSFDKMVIPLDNSLNKLQLEELTLGDYNFEWNNSLTQLTKLKKLKFGTFITMDNIFNDLDNLEELCFGAYIGHIKGDYLLDNIDPIKKRCILFKYLNMFDWINHIKCLKQLKYLKISAFNQYYLDKININDIFPKLEKIYYENPYDKKTHLSRTFRSIIMSNVKYANKFIECNEIHIVK